MKKHIYLLFALFVCLTSCSQTKPENIEESIAYFEKKWTDNEKNAFKNKTEEDAVTELHMTVGMWIRNSWIRNENDSLANQFHKIGVYHPDDISTIILTSLHRKLNNKEIKLDEQAQKYIEYWKPIMAKNEKSKKIAYEIYNKHKVGDKINIYYPVSTRDGESNAVIYEDNEEWIFNPKTDLKVSGIIKEKFFLGNETNVFFKLEITEMNNEKIKVLMQEMKIGNTYDFHLDKLTID